MWGLGKPRVGQALLIGFAVAVLAGSWLTLQRIPLNTLGLCVARSKVRAPNLSSVSSQHKLAGTLSVFFLAVAEASLPIFKYFPRLYLSSGRQLVYASAKLGLLRHPISRTKAPVLIAFEVITVFQGACIYASREYFIIFTHRVDAYFRP